MSDTDYTSLLRIATDRCIEAAELTRSAIKTAPEPDHAELEALASEVEQLSNRIFQLSEPMGRLRPEIPDPPGLIPVTPAPRPDLRVVASGGDDDEA